MTCVSWQEEPQRGLHLLFTKTRVPGESFGQWLDAVQDHYSDLEILNLMTESDVEGEIHEFV